MASAVSSSLVAALVLAAAASRGRAALFANGKNLLPWDNGYGPVLAGRQPYTQYVGHLAGPWGLPISTDAPNLLGEAGRALRAATKRVVVFYDLNYPQGTYRRTRAAVDREGGYDHVRVVTVGFPTASKLRGLRLPRPACAARWHQDFDWLSNQAVPAMHRQHCHDVGPMPTPCELLLGLVERFRAPLFPNLEHVTVSGFSAGGQLLDRCMYSVRRTLDPYFLGQTRAALAAAHGGGPWQCYSWGQEDERHLRRGRQIFRQRQVCEKDRGDGFVYRFAQGEEHLAPGCGGCGCCRRHGHVDIAGGLRHVSFVIVSPSTLLYPVPERAVLPKPSELKCHSFDPKSVLRRFYNFEVPKADVTDMASISRTPSKKACRHYNHYRYGLKGKVPPDMGTNGTVATATVRRAILGHHAFYVAGSADVCNWEVQSQLSPQCGFCKFHRSMVAHPWDHRFAFDQVSPVVSSCGAMWQGMTRFERMKIYKDLLDQVVAPRFGILQEELHRQRHFRVVVGLGHDDNDVVQKLARCFTHGFCSSGDVLPMEDFAPREDRRPSGRVFFRKYAEEATPASLPRAAEVDVAGDRAASAAAAIMRPSARAAAIVSLQLVFGAVAFVYQRRRRRSAAEAVAMAGGSESPVALLNVHGQLPSAASP